MQKSKTNTSGRVHLLDEVRGLSIILMVIYHFFFDLVIIFRVNIPLFYTSSIVFLAHFFAGVFIFISGTVCNYSRSNLKRGVICFLLGLLVSLITYFFNSGYPDLFGILHFLGVSMVLFVLLKKPLSKVPTLLGMIIFAILFIATFNLQNGYLFFENFLKLPLPESLYETNNFFFLGFHNELFASSDYFPMFPWVFLFFLGSFFGRLLKEDKMPKFFYKKHIPPLAFIGRYTIYIYLIHQPVLMGILYVTFYFAR